MDVLLVQAGPRCCALPTSAVDEILCLGPVTPIPFGPPAVAGATNVRGRVLAVLRTSVALGLPDERPTPGTSRGAVLVRTRHCPVVLQVDRTLTTANLAGCQVLSSSAAGRPVHLTLDGPWGEVELVDIDRLVQQVISQARALGPTLAPWPAEPPLAGPQAQPERGTAP